MAYKNILVAIDGSEVSNVLIKKVHEFAPDAHLDILNVVDTSGGYFGTIVMNADIIYQMEQDAEEAINKSYEYALEIGHNNVDVHVRFGSPKQVVARDFPKDHSNDLIVVGETGLNSIQRVMSGTVPSFVTQSAKTDVLIMRVVEK
ncbi:universal stress protein [Leuconostoc palmae]|uniref:universal stress protein n=1 Tax=Leuconostoc palmae TaxID=501487 RepID=UPI001C7D6376|nr:universal stress protein [Leuconostoc palmae]